MGLNPKDFDFSGWATVNNIKCSDGRVIRNNAFIDCDGLKVPLCYNHNHKELNNVIGHALLENRNKGVYCYCSFNNTENGKNAKECVAHGDVVGLSIYANELKQRGSDVVHGIIREVSLVLAGANPGATIDNVAISHSDGWDEIRDEEAIISFVLDDELMHSAGIDDDDIEDGDVDDLEDDVDNVDDADDSKESDAEDGEIEHMDEDMKKEPEKDSKEETVGDIIESMNEKQQNVMYMLIADALDSKEKKEGEDSKNNEGDEEDMKIKHNVFDSDTKNKSNVLSHAAQMEILDMAKDPGIGSFKSALKIYAAENEDESDALAHSIDDIEQLFPDYKNLDNGEPETLTRDYTWVDGVINGTAKSPVSRVRTRKIDARKTGIRAKGYVKGTEKVKIGNATLLSRTTDPQTVYVTDELHRDDVIDITDFDVVNYEYKLMRGTLKEDLALAIMVGDGREVDAPDKIKEDHIRPIWKDDDLFTIHQDVDLAAARAELQGTETGAHFGENYIYAEAIIQATLYAREQYKGSGSLTFYCTPHTLNVMLLARDLNGRRIYTSKNDLAAALDVVAIETAEQFEGLTRTEGTGQTAKTKKLLGLFVNLKDYQIGATKGGEITKFEDFDIHFNKYEYLLETRCSGALTRVYSAIALEEDITAQG